MILNTIQAGQGRPVVLLHGLFGAARNFGPIQRALAGSFRIIACDMRNHGASPHEPGMDYRMQAADIRETLQALGIASAAIVGHSMGGKAAMALALTAPEMVERLLVSDIAPVSYVHGNQEIAAALQALPLSPALTRAQADAALQEAVAKPDVRAFLLQNVQFGADARFRIGLPEIAAAIAELEGWPDLTGAYEGLCLFVTGARSDHVRPEYRPVIRQYFPSARFVAIKNAGHWVHADNPTGFLSVLQAFLANWPPAG